MDIFFVTADDFLFRELLGVASGTWASLIGSAEYSTIDETRDKIVMFYLETKANASYETWQDVWTAYKASK